MESGKYHLLCLILLKDQWEVASRETDSKVEATDLLDIAQLVVLEAEDSEVRALLAEVKVIVEAVALAAADALVAREMEETEVWEAEEVEGEDVVAAEAEEVAVVADLPTRTNSTETLTLTGKREDSRSMVRTIYE